LGKSRPLKIMVNPDAGCVPTAPSLCCVRGADIGGLEYQATNKTSFAAYYGELISRLLSDLVGRMARAATRLTGIPFRALLLLYS